MVVFHGLGAHARFPTVVVAAEALVCEGYTVVALDMPGHGESEGLRGFIYSPDALEEDGFMAVNAALDAYPTLPLFLLGSSMGGAICHRVALRLPGKVSGLVLLAPMLAPAASAAARLLLGALSVTPICRLALIPSSATTNDVQYADPEMRDRIEADTLAYKEALRVGSAYAVLELGRRCEASLADATCPILCLVAERDQVRQPLPRGRRSCCLPLVSTTPSLCFHRCSGRPPSLRPSRSRATWRR